MRQVMSGDEVKRAYQLRKQGLTFNQIAVAMGRKYNTIVNRFKWDAMTPEERRSAVMASMAGQAQLAADIMRLDAGTGYDRCADLLNNAAGSLRQATGAYPSRMNLGALD